ncbi:MAG: hypothetical protein ACLFRD_04030, partial [Nitriliruptoraceae bacterium]
MADQSRQEVRVYVASGGGSGPGGVYLYRLALADGSLELVGRAQGLEDAAYVALDPRNRYLYA